MKKICLSLVLVIGALGALSATAAECAMPAAGSCCGSVAQPMALNADAKPDLLTTCPVSGEKLGEMGAPYTFTYKDQEVKLCCKSCKKKFDKDPEKYMAIIRAADKK